MKPSVLLLAVISIIAFGSCTTAYKTGQTPDDVYFSPATPEDKYVRTERRDNRRYEGSDEYYDDRFLRMRVRDRYRWSELDDWYYHGNRFSYTYFPQFGFYNNPWSPYSYWNNFYNPYYHGVIIVSPSSPVYSKPRTFNLNAYNNNALTNNNYKNPKASGFNIGGGNFGNNSYNSPNRNNGSGRFLRDLFSGGNNNNNSSGNRVNTGSSSGSSSGSSGGKGSSAPVRRF